jgi:2'-5' RNA ligase
VQPLIVTLALDEPSQRQLDELRRRHFPPERNHLSAHVTLFHALPGGLEEQVRAELADAAERPPLTLRVTGLRFLGRGVAYALHCPELDALRQSLAARWGPHLTTQDRQPHRPHVTVQNKVDPTTARATLQELERGFVPYDVTGCGLALFRYLGPTWEPLGLHPLRPPARGGAAGSAPTPAATSPSAPSDRDR